MTATVTRMTIKEQLFIALQDQGYDFLGACEEAARIIAEAKRLAIGRQMTVTIAGRAFTIQKTK